MSDTGYSLAHRQQCCSLLTLRMVFIFKRPRGACRYTAVPKMFLVCQCMCAKSVQSMNKLLNNDSLPLIPRQILTCPIHETTQTETKIRDRLSFKLFFCSWIHFGTLATLLSVWTSSSALSKEHRNHQLQNQLNIQIPVALPQEDSRSTELPFLRVTNRSILQHVQNGTNNHLTQQIHHQNDPHEVVYGGNLTSVYSSTVKVSWHVTIVTVTLWKFVLVPKPWRELKLCPNAFQIL